MTEEKAAVQTSTTTTTTTTTTSSSSSSSAVQTSAASTKWSTQSERNKRLQRFITQKIYHWILTQPDDRPYPYERIKKKDKNGNICNYWHCLTPNCLKDTKWSTKKNVVAHMEKIHSELYHQLHARFTKEFEQQEAWTEEKALEPEFINRIANEDDHDQELYRYAEFCEDKTNMFYSSSMTCKSNVNIEPVESQICQQQIWDTQIYMLQQVMLAPEEKYDEELAPSLKRMYFIVKHLDLMGNTEKQLFFKIRSISAKVKVILQQQKYYRKKLKQSWLANENKQDSKEDINITANTLAHLLQIPPKLQEIHDTLQEIKSSDKYNDKNTAKIKTKYCLMTLIIQEAIELMVQCESRISMQHSHLEQIYTDKLLHQQRMQLIDLDQQKKKLQEAFEKLRNSVQQTNQAAANYNDSMFNLANQTL
eukprot:80016_1